MVLKTIVRLISKAHFIVGLAMFLFVAMMVVEPDQAMRAFLLVPVVICYSASKILFVLDKSESEKEISERKGAPKPAAQ